MKIKPWPPTEDKDEVNPVEGRGTVVDKVSVVQEQEHNDLLEELDGQQML